MNNTLRSEPPLDPPQPTARDIYAEHIEDGGWRDFVLPYIDAADDPGDAVAGLTFDEYVGYVGRLVRVSIEYIVARDAGDMDAAPRIGDDMAQLCDEVGTAIFPTLRKPATQLAMDTFEALQDGWGES